MCEVIDGKTYTRLLIHHRAAGPFKTRLIRLQLHTLIYDTIVMNREILSRDGLMSIWLPRGLIGKESEGPGKPCSSLYVRTKAYDIRITCNCKIANSEKNAADGLYTISCREEFRNTYKSTVRREGPEMPLRLRCYVATYQLSKQLE